jgi:hypothetical protein
VDRAEGARSFNELYQLVVTSSQPLGAVGAGQGARKVRGEPDGVRFKMGAEEEETDEVGEMGSNHFAVNGLEGGKGGR